MSKKNSKPFTHEQRCAGSVLAMDYAAPKGWTAQVGQQGGKPAMLVFKGGKLARASYLVGDKESLPATILETLPASLKWQGTRANFRVLGQVRKNGFEALAVAMLNDPVIISNLTDSQEALALHHALDTPNSRRHKLPKSKGISKLTVLTSTYRDNVRVVWVRRETGKVLKRIKLDRM